GLAGFLVFDLAVAAYPIADVRSQPYPEGGRRIPNSCPCAAVAEVEHWYEGSVDIAYGKLAFPVIDISAVVLDEADAQVVFLDQYVIFLKLEVVPAQAQPPFHKEVTGNPGSLNRVQANVPGAPWAHGIGGILAVAKFAVAYIVVGAEVEVERLGSTAGFFSPIRIPFFIVIIIVIPIVFLPCPWIFLFGFWNGICKD